MKVYNFAENLRKIMEEKNITMRELSAKSEVTEVSLSRYLTAGREPTITTACNIASALGVSVTDLCYADRDISDPGVSVMTALVPEDKRVCINCRWLFDQGKIIGPDSVEGTICKDCRNYTEESKINRFEADESFVRENYAACANCGERFANPNNCQRCRRNVLRHDFWKPRAASTVEAGGES